MSFIELDFPREVLEISSGGKHGGRYLVKNWGELERYWKGKNGSGHGEGCRLTGLATRG